MSEWVIVGITLIGELVVIGAVYGSLNTRVENALKETEALQVEISLLKNTLVEKYVTQANFDRIIGEIRSDQREMRSDIKEVLNLLHNGRYQ